MSYTAKAGRATLLPHRMNKTEAAYAAHLNMLRAAGQVLDWRFEGVKLRLGDNVHYSPDFLVIAADTSVELHEVKGRKGKSYYATDDARVKIKAAAAQYPFCFRVVWPTGRGTWESETIERA